MAATLNGGLNALWFAPEAQADVPEDEPTWYTVLDDEGQSQVPLAPSCFPSYVHFPACSSMVSG